MMQKLERLRIPELTQGPDLKPGTPCARAVTMITSKVLVTDLKVFRQQLGEELASRAFSMDQEFFADFAQALNVKAESRSDWCDAMYSFLITHSRKVDSFKTEQDVWDWIKNQPEIAKLNVRKDRFTKLLETVHFRDTRGKS